MTQSDTEIKFRFWDKENKAGLVEELKKPFERISVCYPNRDFLVETDRWISSLTLWRADGSGLRISSFVSDVAKRLEVGSLAFVHVEAPTDGEEVFKVQNSFNEIIELKKFVLDEKHRRIESGFYIVGANGAKLLVVPNAMPNNLAIQGDGMNLSFFEPEYDLAEYRVVDWTYSPIP